MILIPLLLTLAPAQAQTAQELPALADALVEAVTLTHYSEATEQARAALEAAPSWTTPPDPQALATLWLVIGAAAVYSGQDEAMVPAFAQACAIDPEHFVADLGKNLQPAWAAACQQATPSASLRVRPLADGSTLYVDGRAQESGVASLAPGEHIVQVLTPEQAPFTAMVQLEAEQRATLDTGIVIPRDPQASRRAVLATSAGATLLAGAALGAMAWRAHGTYSNAYDACIDRSEGCSAATGASIQDAWTQRNNRAVAAGAAGGLALGLSATLVITW